MLRTPGTDITNVNYTLSTSRDCVIDVCNTYFHEAGHILLHGKRDIFIEDDGGNGGENDAKEEEANEFAARTLIPPATLKRFLKELRPGYYPSKNVIRAFAEEISIAPGIVVRRLQHEGVLPFSHCNELKRTFKWVTQPETPGLM